MRHPSEARRRSSRLPLILSGLAALLGVAVLGLGAAYRVGYAQTEARVTALLADLDLNRQLVRDLSARAAAAKRDLAALQRRTGQPDARPGPDGGAVTPPAGAAATALAISPADLQRLVDAIQDRVRQGVTADQLVAALGGVAAPPPPGPCADGQSEQREFLARTPVTRDPSTARFAGGRIRVAGSGVSVRAANGLPEAWFDQTQPVELSFRLGEQTIVKSGVLPVRHEITDAGRTYVFDAAVHTKRGFVTVTMTVCPAGIDDPPG